MAVLESGGWVEPILVHSPRLPRLAGPLHLWSPGGAQPDFGRIAYRARVRWRGPVRTVRAYVATVRAGDLFGGRGGPLKNPLQAAHDAALASVFLVLRHRHPELAARWIGEDALALEVGIRRGERFPDATIRDGGGRPVLAVEFVGASYSKKRIAGFHADCEAKGLPYMLW